MNHGRKEHIQTHVRTVRKVIKLHINKRSIYAFGGSRKTHGTFDAITGTHATIDAAKADLTDLDGTFPSGCGSIDVRLSGSEYFDVVTDDA